jgi:hypothetical protein
MRPSDHQTIDRPEMADGKSNRSDGGLANLRFEISEGTG